MQHVTEWLPSHQHESIDPHTQGEQHCDRPLTWSGLLETLWLSLESADTLEVEDETHTGC